MLKCEGCRRFTWGSLCRVEGEERKACPSNGDETKCALYPERRKSAQERAEAELSRRITAKWFDFDEQKPVHGDCVLGIDTDGNIEVYQYSEEWSNCLMKYDGNIKVFNITHWALLPRPPKGGMSMGKRCGNCANGTWTKGMDAVPEVCLKCEYVHGEPSNWKEKTMTNADRIRAMSDEELAEFLSKADFYCKGNCKKCLRGTACIPMLQWLKQPVEES